MNKSSERKLAENEVIFREANKDIQAVIVGVAESGPKIAVDFYCECSNPECRARITLTVEAYEKLHKNKRQFVLVKGHEIPEVEKVVREEKDFNIVEKMGDPPKPEEIHTALKKIDT